MKKIFAILLIPIFILTTTVGITLISYSCKEMKGQAMASPCCKDVKKGGCCEKNSSILKVKDAFVKVSFASNFSTVLHLIREQAFTLSLVLPFKKNITAKGYWDNAPPDIAVGYYILYHSIIV